MTQTRQDFAIPASEETIQRVAQRIRERNIEVVVVDDGDQARKVVLERLPEGAEVHSGKSKTLQDAGIFDAIHDVSRYDALRPRVFKMDRQTQAREIRKLIAGPDFMLGSVNAVTEDGVLVAVSASASQLGPYASTAGKVILVVGSQKIVPDLETALRRIRDYVLPFWHNLMEKYQCCILLPEGKPLLEDNADHCLAQQHMICRAESVLTC